MRRVSRAFPFSKHHDINATVRYDGERCYNCALLKRVKFTYKIYHETAIIMVAFFIGIYL